MTLGGTSTQKKASGKLIGIGTNPDIEQIIKSELQKIILPVKLEDLKQTHFKSLKTSVKNWYGKNTRFVTIFGAAGPEDIPETKLKVITDHYSSTTRKMLNDAILEDPLLSPSTDRRFDSIFEDGFHLEYVDAVAYDPVQKRHMTAEEAKQKFAVWEQRFKNYLLQLETWKDNIHLIDTMRDAAGVSFAQGNAASLISPGLNELRPGQLPFSVEIIHYSDLGNVIVDIGLTKQIVAIQTKFEDKKICRKDEIVYITRNKRGYRKEGKFFGTSPLEPVLTISKSIKRIYNYDIPEAVIAAYITKILFRFFDGVDENEAATFIRNFLTTGKIAFGMTNVENIDVVQPKVDVVMIDILEKKLADILLSIVGVPKSMLNREHSLNRDIATVEAIQFMKFVRKPDEQLLADEFESQLFNTLLSIEFGMPLNQLPKRIKIVRNSPEKDLDTVFESQNNLQSQKTGEISSANLYQSDSVSMFGASGKETYKIKKVGDEYLVTN